MKRSIWSFVLAGLLLVPPIDVASAQSSDPRTSKPVATRDMSFRVRAKAALILNMQSGEVLYRKNPMARLSVASITKLMTAVTLMNMNPDLSKRIQISRQDVYRANWTQLKYREKVGVKDLLYAALISSDNVAARVLARVSGLSNKEFVERMNQTAASLGLLNSRFTEPTGLDAGNVSTAVDCAALLWTALQNDVLSEVLTTKEYTYSTNRRVHNIKTTNRLLRGDQADADLWESIGSKTGYIRKAGYCLVMRARSQSGDDVIAVVLGGVSSRTRFADMRRLLNWSLHNIGQQEHIGG